VLWSETTGVLTRPVHVTGIVSAARFVSLEGVARNYFLRFDRDELRELDDRLLELLRLDADLRPRVPDELLRPLDRLELDRFRPDERCDLVSPDCARCLFTVRAAISSARSSPTPRSRSESLMCSYWRFRLGLLTPRGGMWTPFGAIRARSKTAQQNCGHEASGTVW
jgi:hypothetical protein